MPKKESKEASSGKGNEAIRALGALYCGAYLLSLIACGLTSWLYWDAWKLDNSITRLAEISSASIGIALFVALLREAAHLIWYGIELFSQKVQKGV